MTLIYQGILLGLGLSVLVGPIFFALLDTCLRFGMRGGFFMAAGVWLSDALFMGLIWYQVSMIRAIAQHKHFSVTVGVLGGVVLIITGLLGILRKAHNTIKPSEYNSASILSVGARGFLANTLNPFTVLFWLTVISNFATDNQVATPHAMMFFGAILGTLMLTDLLKIFLAKRIKDWFSPRVHLLAGRIIGLLLIAFGALLIVRVL